MFEKIFNKLEPTKEQQEHKELVFELAYKVGGLSFLLLSFAIPVLFALQQIVKETIGVGVNEKAVLRFYQTALSFTSISIFPW